MNSQSANKVAHYVTEFLFYDISGVCPRRWLQSFHIDLWRRRSPWGWTRLAARGRRYLSASVPEVFTKITVIWISPLISEGLCAELWKHRKAQRKWENTDNPILWSIAESVSLVNLPWQNGHVCAVSSVIPPYSSSASHFLSLFFLSDNIPHPISFLSESSQQQGSAPFQNQAFVHQCCPGAPALRGNGALNEQGTKASILGGISLEFFKTTPIPNILPCHTHTVLAFNRPQGICGFSLQKNSHHRDHIGLSLLAYKLLKSNVYSNCCNFSLAIFWLPFLTLQGSCPLTCLFSLIPVKPPEHCRASLATVSGPLCDAALSWEASCLSQSPSESFPRLRVGNNLVTFEIINIRKPERPQ